MMKPQHTNSTTPNIFTKSGSIPVPPPQALDDQDIKNFVFETYRPLTSPNGADGWTVMGAYSVRLPPPSASGHLGREVWVETALLHFCTVANGVKVNIPGYNHHNSSDDPYYRGDMGGFSRRMRWKFKGTPSKPMVRLGNATQARVLRFMLRWKFERTTQ